MDRSAIFVDVGYLYAAGGMTCLGVKTRARMRVDIPGVVRMLCDTAASECSMPLLRTYWYDGASQGIPTSEHLRAVLVDDVKLRLGRINSRGQQKGVDALIYRDLMTLARERAVSHAFLVAGDGDLVEGVRAAQDLGTHVTLIHIAAGKGSGTSPDLLHEADRRIRLLRDDLSPFFELAPHAKGGMPTDDDQVVEQSTYVTAAQDYARTWFDAATDSDVASLIAGRPRIPSSIDAELMRTVTTAVGVLLRDEDARRAIRKEFWDAADRLRKTA